MHGSMDMTTRRQAARRVALTYTESAARNAARYRRSRRTSLLVASCMCLFVVVAVFDSIGAF